MLAIVTPDPDTTAETFVRQHIRLIAPGNTAVVYFEGAGKFISSLPSLKIDRISSGNVVKQKLQTVLSLVRYGYGGALRTSQRAQAFKFFNENQIKCVLAEFGQTACAVSATCHAARIPLYAYFHGHDATVSGQYAVYKYAYRRMSKSVAGVFATSNYLAKRVQEAGVQDSKIHIVPCGIELESFDSHATRNPNLLLAVGRMVEKKAPHLTVKAFALVQQKFPQARLEMIGDGPMLEECRNVAHSLGITQSIVFHGAMPHEFVKSMISNASIFVQHSVTAPNGDTESQGVSLLEAMASEVPVVTTRHNGFVETVEDGRTGYLVNEHDVQGMADRIIELLSNVELSRKMGIAGRQRVVEHYSSEVIAKRLREIMHLECA